MLHHVFENTLQKEGYLSVCNLKKMLSLCGQFVSIDNLLKSKPGEYHKNFVITFDDGHEDMFEYAYPILNELGIPFTMFIVTDFIDKKKFITKQQLLELSRNPLVTIGSHTKTHTKLNTLTFAQRKEEISTSKTILENILGKEIKYFSYPFGEFSDEDMELVKASGYQRAFDVEWNPYNFYTCAWKYKLPRYNIDDISLTELFDFFTQKYNLNTSNLKISKEFSRI